MISDSIYHTKLIKIGNYHIGNQLICHCIYCVESQVLKTEEWVIQTLVFVQK